MTGAGPGPCRRQCRVPSSDRHWAFLAVGAVAWQDTCAHPQLCPCTFLGSVNGTEKPLLGLGRTEGLERRWKETGEFSPLVLGWAGISLGAKGRGDDL